MDSGVGIASSKKRANDRREAGRQHQHCNIEELTLERLSTMGDSGGSMLQCHMRCT